MTIFIQSCLLYSSEDEANGREICMKYKGNVHVMYYCENENKEQ